jgi:hypothetical protein
MTNLYFVAAVAIASLVIPVGIGRFLPANSKDHIFVLLRALPAMAILAYAWWEGVPSLGLIISGLVLLGVTGRYSSPKPFTSPLPSSEKLVLIAGSAFLVSGIIFVAIVMLTQTRRI